MKTKILFGISALLLLGSVALFIWTSTPIWIIGIMCLIAAIPLIIIVNTPPDPVALGVEQLLANLDKYELQASIPDRRLGKFIKVSRNMKSLEQLLKDWDEVTQEDPFEEQYHCDSNDMIIENYRRWRAVYLSTLKRLLIHRVDLMKASNLKPVI